MGPFGIAAVGLLAKKKKKKEKDIKPTNCDAAENSSRSGLHADSASQCMLATDHNGADDPQDPEQDVKQSSTFPRKKGKPLRISVEVSRPAAVLFSVRNVESASDCTSHGAMPSPPKLEGTSERSSVRLQRSSRIKVSADDSFFKELQVLRTEGHVEDALDSEDKSAKLEEDSQGPGFTNYTGNAFVNIDSPVTNSGSSTDSTLLQEADERLVNKEMDSPRYKALLRLTGGHSKRRNPGAITSFSHELTSPGLGSHPFCQHHNGKNSQAIVGALEDRFSRAKKEIDAELAGFAADILDIMELEAGKKDEDIQSKQEDLLIIARQCSVMSVEDFRLQCESIVQKLEDERQSLPIGRLKQLHTRLLFILTRCTRLLQYQKENSNSKDRMLPKDNSAKRYYSQEQPLIYRLNDHKDLISSETNKLKSLFLAPYVSSLDNECVIPSTASLVPSLDNECVAPSMASLVPGAVVEKMYNDCQQEQEHQHKSTEVMSPGAMSKTSDHQAEIRYVICRICEDEVPTYCLEEHSRICALAVRYDVKGLNVDDRLRKLAEILDRMLDSPTPGSSDVIQGDSPEIYETSTSSKDISQDIFTTLHECQKGQLSLQGLPEVKEAGNIEVLSKKGLSLKSEQGHKSSSTGSITPKSPLTTGSITPKSPLTTSNHFDAYLDEWRTLGEDEDPRQVSALADMARRVSCTTASEDGGLEYLSSCSKYLQDHLKHSKNNALTVYTFGKRIEKLIRRKYTELSEFTGATKIPRETDESNRHLKEGIRQSFRRPAYPPYKDRTSIDDFEIIKPISRGAFGRVFLARKRTTGDLFAIKVLRKADMIRKNAVESILAERDILISTRNPFVVRFFYSFTCTENLYLVMEYLIGGDLYSLLRNVGCLDEKISRIYIAEVVLALEYLHSLGVVHRDLKPDNLLIAHDGHIKLTDFGLSKVGLINSTDDLSGPAITGERYSNGGGMDAEQSRERRQKHSAVGTPDYLAPEILLGTTHGSSADWWSTGIILFECLTGVPPFNADHPQRIFENILNHKIPWPKVPDDMSYEAKDLIDKLLCADPHMRLGANGAAEVKGHPFFKDINWDTLARQKAAFIPNPDTPHDTSYFTSRKSWSSSEGIISSIDEHGCYENDECSNIYEVDKPTNLVDFSNTPPRFSFSNFSFKNLSQLASINYDLLMQSTQDESIG